MKRKHLIISGCVLALAAGGAGIAQAVGGDDEVSVTGPSADKARAAALSVVPGGRANAVERDSEDGATWEVEVTRPDGTTVDVRLDERYRQVGVDRDNETEDGGAE